LTTLDKILVSSAAIQNRILVREPAVEQGYYFRSDQFPIARRVVPAVFPAVVKITLANLLVTASIDKMKNM
jgi:hypothetical protein